MHESNKNGLYSLFNGCFALILADGDWDLDLHAICQESSGIPTPPPCLATDFEQPRRILSDGSGPAGYECSGSSSIECVFHPTCDNLSAFKWTGPDPLSMSTQASDLFLHVSALAFPKEVLWIEFRLVEYSSQSTLSPLGTLQTTLSLNPEVFMHNILGGYK